jgi:hypothetical protein
MANMLNSTMMYLLITLFYIGGAMSHRTLINITTS